MAEATKSLFDQSKEAALKYLQYNSVVRAIQAGKFIPNLSEIAENAANEVEEGILDEDGKNNRATDNTSQHYDYIDGAAKKFGIRTQNLFEKNLEAIIDSSPQKALENLEKMLFNFAPKEKV